MSLLADITRIIAVPWYSPGFPEAWREYADSVQRARACDVSNREVRQLVAVFLKTPTGCRVTEVVQDCDGLGLCLNYSCLLADWLVERGYPAFVEYIEVRRRPHWVAILGEVRIDLTMRQFRQNAAFPYFSRVARFQSADITECLSGRVTAC